MKGICKICGCTENNPCIHPEFGPCWWLDEDKQDLCGHCVELKGDPGVTRPPIRALSLRQPFASLMLPPFNKIETRTWSTSYRGPVLICASQKAYPWNVVRDICGPDQFDRLLSSKMQKELILTGTDGHAIALGILVDCRSMQKEDEDKCFVQYYPGLWCHVYENVRPIKPFPWKGCQGWKVLTKEQTQKIELL